MEIQLKKYRIRKGLKQKEMAEKLNVKVGTYRSWESGKRMPNLKQAFECAVILECSIDDIVGYAPPIESQLPDPKEFFEKDSKSPEMIEMKERHEKEISSMRFAGGKKEQSYKDPDQEALNRYFESMNDEGKKRLVGIAELAADSDKVRVQKKPEGVPLPPEMEGIA